MLSDPRNIGFVCEGGAILCSLVEPGIYEVSTAFLPTWRGAYALAMAKQAHHWMFTETDCMTLLMRVPDDNPAARWFYRALGAVQEFRRDFAWPAKDDGAIIGMSFLALRFEQWFQTARAMDDAGAEFVTLLCAERARLGREQINAECDPCNIRHIGAFSQMALAGQIDKAVILYNRFAYFALLPLIQPVSRTPTMFELDGTLMQAKDRRWKAILCR